MSWCQSGHRVEIQDPYCSQCGRPSVIQCAHGHLVEPAVGEDGVSEERPDYCRRCGVSLPWKVGK